MFDNATGCDGLPPMPCSDVESAERARQLEIASYLAAASFPPQMPTGVQSNVAVNDDTTLNALVQLGALRLDCDRAFLSLIDREYQFIIGEMTKTNPLDGIGGPLENQDKVYLGVCKLELCWGVCPTTMKAFMDETGQWIQTGPNVIANKTRYIINDFRTDPLFFDKPYTTGFPYMVSYLEVPLISPLGYVIGSYCVIDKKPRDFDSDFIVGIMDNIASSIMDHLDLVKIKRNRHRSEQLIDNLSEFVRYGLHPNPNTPQNVASDAIDSESTSSIPKADTTTFEDSVDRNVLIVKSNSVKDLTQASQVPVAISRQSSTELTESASNTEEDSTPTPLTSPPSVQGVNPFETAIADSKDGVVDDHATSPSSPSAPSVHELHTNDPVSSSHLKSTFLRAATGIKNAMNMDGLVFVDAISTGETGILGTTISPDNAPHALSGPTCRIIAQDITTDTSKASSSTPGIRLPEALLHELIRNFSQGHVFTADEFGPIETTYGPGKPMATTVGRTVEDCSLMENVTALFDILPPARYAIFLPLWHPQRECWYAVALGWLSTASHAFGVADLSLLSAFGHSVMAEISRSEAIASSKTKSNFVSSISHELRSPLHGILASSELLREAIHDASLLSTLDMISSCGKTLLDIFNNLIDHAGNTALHKTNKAIPIEKTEEDLAKLVEDVVEAVHTSFVSDNTLRLSIQETSDPSTGAADATLRSSTLPVLVILNIENRVNWKMPLDVGVWKRIVMNIFGNALKYTRSGHIEISLRMAQQRSETGDLCDCICFSVMDTGRGISSDYLKYDLFTPFSQECDLSPGIGLGLSIVKQLVLSLGGTLSVKSALRRGTSFDILVPITQDSTASAQGQQLVDGGHHISQPTTLMGKTVCFVTPELPTVSSSTGYATMKAITDRSALLEKTLKSITEDCLGMKFAAATQASLPPEADVYIIDGGVVCDSKVDCYASLRNLGLSPMVLLCPGFGQQSCSKHAASRSYKNHLHHPIGAAKMASVLLSALRSHRGPNSFSSSPQELLGTGNTPIPDPSYLKSSAEEGDEAPVASVVSPRLLLVDDNPINVKLLTAVAGKLNLGYATAYDGLEAVKAFEASLRKGRPFSTIFMDASMPVMNGFEATRRIRQLEKEAGVIGCKLVMLTGLSGVGNRDEALASGADLFFTKPVKLEQVKELLSAEPEKSNHC